MPKKRISYTANAIRLRRRRGQLTPEEKEIRKEKQRIYMAQYRASQTEEQRQKRREADKLATRRRRVNQIYKQRARIRKLFLSMQSKPTFQEKVAVIKKISIMVNGSNTNTAPMPMMTSTHPIKQDPDELINNSQELLEQKCEELQQYLQSIKTEMIAPEKTFMEEKAKFQQLYSVIRDTYNIIESTLANLDMNVCANELITVNQVPSKATCDQPVNLTEVGDKESTTDDNVLNYSHGAITIKVEPDMHHEIINCQMNQVANEENTHYNLNNVPNSSHGVVNIKVEPDIHYGHIQINEVNEEDRSLSETGDIGNGLDSSHEAINIKVEPDW